MTEQAQHEATAREVATRWWRSQDASPTEDAPESLVAAVLSALTAATAQQAEAPLLTYMTTESRELRSAAYLRIHAEHVRHGTAEDIPNTVASTLEGIALHLESLPAQLAQQAEEIARLTAALKAIAEHPHVAYDHPSNLDTTGGNYGIGCADGHRCAATVARAALSEGTRT